MSEARRLILQLDFDGTVTHGDPSVGLLTRYGGPEWAQRIEEAGRAMLLDPGTPRLIETMQAGFDLLPPSSNECLDYARERFPARAGLGDLLAAADGLGISVEAVSYGFEFYILDYLRAARATDCAIVRAGKGLPGGERGLEYVGPDGRAVTSRWKERWAEHYRDSGAYVLYAGDGSSDVSAAGHAALVFARDALLQRLPSSYTGPVRPFEDLHDIASGLRRLFSG